MLHTRSLPSLFGRLTALGRDHGALGAWISRLERLIERLLEQPSEASRGEWCQLIGEWRAQLDEHFRAEESDVYFGLFLREQPALANHVAELRDDHTTMLETADALAEHVRRGGCPRELASRMTSAIAHFRQHERREAALIREFFGADPNR